MAALGFPSAKPDHYFFLSGFRDELTRFEVVFLESSFAELSLEDDSLPELSFEESAFEESLFEESSDFGFSSFFDSELPPSDAGACDLFA
jgi:hypothetical protein